MPAVSLSSEDPLCQIREPLTSEESSGFTMQKGRRSSDALFVFGLPPELICASRMTGPR